MSAASGFVIFVRDDGDWQIAAYDDDRAAPLRDVSIPAPADTTTERWTAAAVAALREAIPAGATVTLALPSQWFLCATVDGADLPRTSRRQALLYRMEEKLPVAAEEVAADFVPLGDGQFLGVAMQLQRVEPLVRALDDAGWIVQHVTPAALLAAQSYLESPDAAACDALLFAQDGRLELVMTAGQGVRDWHLLTGDAGDVMRDLGIRALSHSPPLRVACSGVQPSILTRLREIAQLEVREVKLPSPQHAAVNAAKVAAEGGRAPWVELRRDALSPADPYRASRRAMNVALVAAVVFCACLCGALFWRAAAYNRIAERYRGEQAAVFAEVFDGKRPADGLNIPSRLAAEERRVRAMAGESLDLLPSRASAPNLLHRVLSRFPADAACRVSELRINEDKLYVEGAAPSHAHAASVAAALAADGTMKIDAPSTEQLAGGGGVSMRVTGVAVAAAPPARPGAGPTTRKAGAP